MGQCSYTVHRSVLVHSSWVVTSFMDTVTSLMGQCLDIVHGSVLLYSSQVSVVT